MQTRRKARYRVLLVIAAANMALFVASSAARADELDGTCSKCVSSGTEYDCCKIATCGTNDKCCKKGSDCSSGEM
jgi:hypothetical protein